MRFVRRGALLVLLLVMTSVAFAATSYSGGRPGVVHITFEKAAAREGVWRGTVAGDVEGRLKTVLLAGTPSADPAVLNVTFD